MYTNVLISGFCVVLFLTFKIRELNSVASVVKICWLCFVRILTASFISLLLGNMRLDRSSGGSLSTHLYFRVTMLKILGLKTRSSTSKLGLSFKNYKLSWVCGSAQTNLDSYFLKEKAVLDIAWDSTHTAHSNLPSHDFFLLWGWYWYLG